MATIQELESFKMSDAVKFHKELNPQLWEDHKLDPEVRDQLLLIAEDFVEYLGLDNLKVEDVTISGSNAAYSYTPHSDLDLHILVDFNELPNNEVYQELFTAKKTLYNDAHDISVHGVPVELYVQDTNNPVHSLGEYSIVHDRWIRIPKKRRANYDEAATKAKYEKLGDLIEIALKSKDPKRVADTIALVKRYRKSGLDKHGEFGPENLAYKAVRKQGLVQALYDLKAQLHGEKLSIEEDTGSIADMIKSSLGLKQFIVTEKNNDLYLDSIIVDKKDQNKGLGTKALEQLISYADQTGKRIILTPGLPNKEHGTTSRNRLVKFYKKFGFKENKGRSIDFAMGAGKMYRDPKGQLQEKEHKLLNKPTLTVGELAEKHGVSRMDIATQLDKGIKVELEHTKDKSVAREIALDHLAEDPKYYDKLASVELEEQQLDETVEENQIVNVVSNIAAAQIAKVMKAKESKLLALLDGGLSPKEKLELFGVKVKDLNVPNVNDPLLKKLFNILYIKVNSQVDFYDDPSAPKTLGGYYDGDYTVELFFPAIEYVAGKRESQLKSEIASTLAHEIQHAIDDYKSENAVYAGSNISPAKDMQGYLKLPYEVNARFQEATMDIAKYIAMPKNDGSKTTQADLPELIRYAFEKNRLDKIYEKNQKEYKRLLTRAYKFFDAEMKAPKKATPIPQNIAKRALAWILGKQTKEINESVAYHVTPTRNLRSIMKNGLRPQIGDRSSQLDGEVEGIFLFPSLGDVEAAVSSWLGDEFDEDEELSLLAVDITGLEDNIVQGADYETIVNTTISPDRIKVDDSLLLEASGYIPSTKEKNDPRFKTALTVDIKPDSIKKNAKAFNWKTSRAGIPPQARADGKINENVSQKSGSVSHALVNEFLSTRTNNERRFYAIRDNCGPAASDMRNWLENTKGIKTKRVRGEFVADDVVSKKADFTPDMKKEFISAGLDWNSPEDRYNFIKNNPKYATEWKKIPHYWLTDESGEIYDPTGYIQFINPGLATDLNKRRYIPESQARPDGKIAEDLMREWKSFLAEDQEQQELFPGYDEKHRQERLNAWLGKSQAVTANYKPKVLYHATTKHFDQFRAQNKGFASALGMTFEVDRSGIFLAENPKFAAEYIEDEYGAYKENAVIIPVYLSAQYTFVLTDSGLSPMLNDEALVEEFKEHDIDLRSIYYHVYEDQRWELFDGPEGEEFVANLKKLGYDSAYMYEDSRHLGRNGVWVAFEPSQVKAITNRGSFSPDDPRLMKENG